LCADGSKHCKWGYLSIFWTFSEDSMCFHCLFSKYFEAAWYRLLSRSSVKQQLDTEKTEKLQKNGFSYLVPLISWSHLWVIHFVISASFIEAGYCYSNPARTIDQHSHQTILAHVGIIWYIKLKLKITSFSSFGAIWMCRFKMWRELNCVGLWRMLWL